MIEIPDHGECGSALETDAGLVPGNILLQATFTLLSGFITNLKHNS
jgi:hypothetical protein